MHPCRSASSYEFSPSPLLSVKGKTNTTPRTGEFLKLDGLLPKKKRPTPEDRAREIEGALDWLRTQGAGLVEDESIPSLGKVNTVDISRRTPEARAKDLEDSLNWISNKGNDGDSNDPTRDFRKLDSMLPKKCGQTPEERAREIEEALDLLRSKDPTSLFAKVEIPKHQKIQKPSGSAHPTPLLAALRRRCRGRLEYMV